VATTGELENALEGLQSIAEAMEAALNQVGYGDTDEPGDGEDVSAGPFTDQQYMEACEALCGLCEAGCTLASTVMEPGAIGPDMPMDGAASADDASATELRGPGGMYGNWRL
jgi:hypothetical protein